MIVDRVISGGQSGVDQAALRAARAAGIPTGGTAPRLFLAEVEQPSLDGVTRWWKPEPCPWLATEFGLDECPEPATIPPDPIYRVAWERWVRTAWPPRMRANARDSAGTCWLGGTGSSGYRATARACEEAGKPFL